MTSNLASDEIAQHAIELRQQAGNVNFIRSFLISTTTILVACRKPKALTCQSLLKTVTSGPYSSITFSAMNFLDGATRQCFLSFIHEIIGATCSIDEMLYFLPFSNQELRQLTIAELNKWSERAFKVASLLFFFKSKKSHNLPFAAAPNRAELG